MGLATGYTKAKGDNVPLVCGTEKSTPDCTSNETQVGSVASTGAVADSEPYSVHETGGLVTQRSFISKNVYGGRARAVGLLSLPRTTETRR